MKFNNIDEWMLWLDSDEFKKTIDGKTLHVDNLNKFYTCAELVREIFDNLCVVIEEPIKIQSQASVVVDCKFFYIENDKKEKFAKLIKLADGIEFSHNSSNARFSITVDGIWIE